MKALFAPLPPAAFRALAICALVIFAVAWLAFRYPLSYCDSPGWAPNYLGALIGQTPPHAASPRGWPVTAFLGGLGVLAARFYVPQLIGLVQALVLLGATLALLRLALARATRLALVLLPAVLASLLRHAIYSQTLLSESLAILLLAVLATSILGGDLTPRRGALAGAAAVVLASIRLDLAYFVPLLLARPWLGGAPARGRVLAWIAAGMLGAAVVVGGVGRVVGQQAYPTGRILTIAEWTTLTAAPANPAAAALRSPLTDRLAAEMARGRFRTFEEAMPVARGVGTEAGAGWAAVARLVLYDLVNHPARVIAHRVAVLRDLVASSYAAFWPEYRSRSAYYSRYAAVFSGWTLEELDDGRYSPCTMFAQVQRDYFHATGIANAGACAWLLAAHRAVTPYAVWLWRPFLWLAPVAFLVLAARRRVERYHAWTAAILAGHLLLRALLVCADERYELPVDLLLLGWAAIVIPDALRGLAPAENAESPRR